MPKLKTKSSAKKRLKVRPKGSIKTKKKGGPLSSSEYKRVKKHYLPYHASI